jgi:hypothetical protein
MLAILIARAKEDGQVEGLIPHLVEGGVSILQLVDTPRVAAENIVEFDSRLKL